MLAHHEKVLSELDIMTQPHGEMCVGFKPLAHGLDMDIRDVRRITRHLARKGLAEYFRALTSDDGEFAGAGYCITPAGRAALQSKDGGE